MFSQNEISLLTILQERPLYVLNKNDLLILSTNRNVINSLFSKHCIMNIIAHDNIIGIAITENGRAMIENYLQKVKKEMQSIKLSEEANQLSKDANRKSHFANLIAIIALIIAALSLFIKFMPI